jgi:hypothetical protein
MDHLSQKVCIVHSDIDPYLFHLHSTDLDQPPFSATILPVGVRKPHEPISLSSWQHLTQHQTVVPTRITAANIDTASFYNAEFDPAILFAVFTRVIRPGETEPAYADLKQQWALLSEDQFLNSSDLRPFIFALEAQIKEQAAKFDRFAEPRKVQQTLFEIVLTYALYNWDGIQPLDGLLDFVLPFVDAYLLQFRSLDGCAPAVFELFAAFYENQHFSDLRAFKPQSIQPLFEDVGRRLKSLFPELLHLLAQKRVFSLDFLRKDYSRWFLDLFNDGDVKVLWISILSFSSAYEFFESFIIALLMMVMAKLDELIPIIASEFVEAFHQAKVKADLRTLLVNTQQIHRMCHPPNE